MKQEVDPITVPPPKKTIYIVCATKNYDNSMYICTI